MNKTLMLIRFVCVSMLATLIFSCPMKQTEDLEKKQDGSKNNTNPAVLAAAKKIVDLMAASKEINSCSLFSADKMLVDSIEPKFRLPNDDFHDEKFIVSTINGKNSGTLTITPSDPPAIGFHMHIAKPDLSRSTPNPVTRAYRAYLGIEENVTFIYKYKDFSNDGKYTLNGEFTLKQGPHLTEGNEHKYYESKFDPQSIVGKSEKEVMSTFKSRKPEDWPNFSREAIIKSHLKLDPANEVSLTLTGPENFLATITFPADFAVNYNPGDKSAPSLCGTVSNKTVTATGGILVKIGSDSFNILDDAKLAKTLFGK